MSQEASGPEYGFQSLEQTVTDGKEKYKEMQEAGRPGADGGTCKSPVGEGLLLLLCQ